MKTMRSVIALAALAAFVFFGPEVLVSVLTGTPITGTSPFRELVTALQVSSVLLVVLLIASAFALARRDDREPEEVLISGLRWYAKFTWLWIRIVVAIMVVAMVAVLVAGAVVGLFSPKDVAIYLGVPLLTGLTIGTLLLMVRAYFGRRNNHPTS